MSDRKARASDPWAAPVPGPRRHGPADARAPGRTPRAVRAASLPTQPTQAPTPVDTVAARPVRVVAVDMPFWSLVGLMLKLTLAAIPALLLLLVLLAGLLSLLGVLLGSAIISSLTALLASAIESIPWF